MVSIHKNKKYKGDDISSDSFGGLGSGGNFEALTNKGGVFQPNFNLNLTNFGENKSFKDKLIEKNNHEQKESDEKNLDKISTSNINDTQRGIIKKKHSFESFDASDYFPLERSKNRR